MSELKLSVLDLVPVPEGTTASQALRRVTDLAQLADRLGYERYWFAEHHAMPSVASSAPEILIGHVAAATRRLRVGSGGIMLPNHSSLRVAENFRTLEALFPNRIDLGLGRAPGGVPGASRALRAISGDLFPQQLADLHRYAPPRDDDASAGLHDPVHAVPADAPLPPIWLLGSSGASAQFAGESGYGYAFASHFSPAPPGPPLRAYREHFRPSAAFAEPHAILGVAVVCAPTDDEARYLAGTLGLMWLRQQSGRFLPLPSPETAAAYPYDEYERQAIREYAQRTVVGSPQTVRARLLDLAASSGADELMITSNLHGHAERLRSFELLSKALS